MARTSLCLRFPGFKLSLLLVFTLTLGVTCYLRWVKWLDQRVQFQNLRRFGPKDTSLSPAAPNSGIPSTFFSP